MSKSDLTIGTAKNKLKYKAAEESGNLKLRIKGKKIIDIPHGVRLISSDDYVYLSFVASSNIYKIENGKLVELDKDDNGSEAYTSLSKTIKSGKSKATRRGTVEMPEALKAALAGLGKDQRLAYRPGKGYVVVRTRTRKPKGA